jgi:hypothetical protein
MTDNVEARLLLKADQTNETIKQLSSFIDREWKDGDAIEPHFLRSYSLMHEATREARRTLGKKIALRKPTSAASLGDPLTWDWKTFARLVQADSQASERVSVLRIFRAYLAERDFGHLEVDQRRAIAGTYGKEEAAADVLDWNLFGRMGGFGHFKKLVRSGTGALALGKALNAIPATGPVTQQKLMLINAFISEHIAESIQVEQLAALMYTSPSHFARAFKKATGCPLIST